MARRALVPITTPIHTSLPSSPLDGQVIDYLADSTNGIVWRLRYRSGSSSSYKWEFVGGSALSSQIMTSEGTSSSTVVDLATVGPVITIPLAGDYDFIGTAMIGTTAAAGAYGDGMLVAGPNGGPFNALDAADFGRSMDSSASSGINADIIFDRRRTIATAGWLAKMQYRSGGTSVTFAGRRLTALPVRVG